MAISLYKKMLEVWGEEAQVLKACEELAELQQAIVKQVQKGRWKKRVTEEIADVELMIGQMKYVFGITNKDIKKYKTNKIKKILFRVSKKQKEK